MVGFYPVASEIHTIASNRVVLGNIRIELSRFLFEFVRRDSAMNLLVIGGTKFIGRTVVERARELGHEVAIFHRGETEPDDLVDVLHVHGDHLAIADSLDQLKAFGPDAVVDTTQGEAATTQAVVDALTGVVERYVLVSSMDVYRVYGLIHNTEPGPPQPMPVSETAELRTLPGADHTEEVDNLLAEAAALEQTGLSTTVARLPAVFGPRDYQRRVGFQLEAMDESPTEVKMTPRRANFRWTWGFVQNIADMLLELAADRRAGNRIYNLGYSEAASNAEMFKMIAEEAGWNGDLVVEDDGSSDGSNLLQDWIADTSKFRRDFDYTERFSIEEAFRMTVESVLLGGSGEHD
jgi:nucleoside-diphosphate-sugar epimerase